MKKLTKEEQETWDTLCNLNVGISNFGIHVGTLHHDPDSNCVFIWDGEDWKKLDAN